MPITRYRGFALVAYLLAGWSLVPSAGAVPVILIKEDFSDGAGGPVAQAADWTNSSGSPEVGAGTTFATNRALATTYDNDNDASTADVNIPGGLEVNASAV